MADIDYTPPKVWTWDRSGDQASGGRFAAINRPPYVNDVDWTKPPPQPRPAADLEAYAGAYRNELYGSIEIQRSDTGLTIGLGPDLQPFPLTHFDGDTFTYQPVGENAYGPKRRD